MHEELHKTIFFEFIFVLYLFFYYV